MSTKYVALLVALLLSLTPAATAAAPPEKPAPEENILRAAGLPVDDDGLLTLFRRRTLSIAESKQIGELINRLGGDDFDDREIALKELRNVGGRAILLLREAVHSADLETSSRARRLLGETRPPAPLPAVAAARLLARRAPADAVPVLMAYLPFADDDGAVEDEVQAALLALTPDGKADPVLTAALGDAQPAKRAAAAYVLGRKGDKDQQAAVRKRLGDVDARVRWQAARALLAAHDRAAVPGLVDLLAEGPFDTAWRAEEVLQRLAGDQAPAVTLDDSVKTRGQCRDAWAAWWKDKGDGLDLTPYKEAERPLGYTLGVEYNTGRVWECDIDGSIRWEIRDLDGPMDAQVLPNGHVLIAEADAHRITERDLKGAVLWEKKIDGEPNGCQRLANGNTFVSTCDPISAHYETRATEYKPDGAAAYSIKLGDGINAVRKGRDGFIYYPAGWVLWTVNTAGRPRLDQAGAARVVPLLKGEVQYVSLEVLPGDRCLVADSRMGRVLEVRMSGELALPASRTGLTDKVWASLLKGGKILWQADLPGAFGVERLPNGHTLVSTNHKVVELDTSGKEVWTKDTEGYPRRVHRR